MVLDNILKNRDKKTRQMSQLLIEMKNLQNFGTFIIFFIIQNMFLKLIFVPQKLFIFELMQFRKIPKFDIYNNSNLKMHLLKTVFCYWVIFSSFTQTKKTEDQKTQLKTRINTQQIYQSVNVKSEQLYYISVDRLQSTKQDQGARCTSQSKYIDITNQREVFRLSKGENQNRNQKVYEKLTSLNEQQNIIEQFEVIGKNIFLITTQGDGYYVDIDNSGSQHKVKTNFFDDHKGPFVDMIVIKDYKDRALIMGKNKIVLCKLENDICDNVQGYDKVESFRGAELYEDDGKYYIFIVQGEGIITYELTANGKVKDKKEFGATFFGTNQISLRAIYRVENKLLVLDDMFGVREVTTEGGLGNFNKTKLVYEQYGCYQIVGQDKGDSLALACAPSLNNYFILKIAKSRQFAEAIYQPLETVFLHQKLYQVDYVENILLSRVFSGVKLFWSSKIIGYPYPHFYRKAGDLFLHNAIQAKLKIFNNKKSIVLAAQDELLIYELKTVNPYVSCSSKAQISQSYKLTYYFPCRQQAFMHQENICDYEEQLRFQAWEHKELKMNSHILPFIFLLLGVVGVVYLLIKLQKKYSTDVELARLKYNVDGNQLDY